MSMQRVVLALVLVVVVGLGLTQISFVGCVVTAAQRGYLKAGSAQQAELKQTGQEGEDEVAKAAAQPLTPSTQAESLPALPAPSSPFPAGRNPHRNFCWQSVNGTWPVRPLSPFNAIVRDELRQTATQAALDAKNTKGKAQLKKLLKPYEESANCSWATYEVPDGTEHTMVPMCTHDPEVDVVISKPIHTKHAWWDPFVYNMFHNRLQDGRCPPNRPVVLDLGLNIGSFALYALKRGCHVIGIDALSMNVNRVVQTVVRAVGEDGKPFINRFHAFRNAVGSQLGKVTMAISRDNPGVSRVFNKGATDSEDADTVILEDLLFNLPESERPLIRVGTRDSVSGEWVYALTPLQPHHVYMVKADVEGFEVPALFGMRRLFEGAIRPSAISMEFSLFGNDGQSCEYGEFVRFMYSAGYRFLSESRETQEPFLQEKFEAEMHERLTCATCHKVFEGWWIL